MSHEVSSYFLLIANKIGCITSRILEFVMELVSFSKILRILEDVNFTNEVNSNQYPKQIFNLRTPISPQNRQPYDYDLLFIYFFFILLINNW